MNTQAIVTVHYGKIGGNGRTVQYKWNTKCIAEKFVNKKISEKLTKGYIETTDMKQFQNKTKTGQKGTQPKQSIIDAKIQRVLKLFDEDYKSGLNFRSDDGWTNTLRQSAKNDIPLYVEDYPDIEEGNIILMLVEDYDKHIKHTKPIRSRRNKGMAPLFKNQISFAIKQAYEVYKKQHPESKQTFDKWVSTITTKSLGSQNHILPRELSDIIHTMSKQNSRRSHNRSVRKTRHST